MAQAQAALNEIMNLQEAGPDSSPQIRISNHPWWHTLSTKESMSSYNAVCRKQDYIEFDAEVF